MSATGEAAAPPGSPSERAEGAAARNTAMFSAFTGFSRIAGLLREIVFASYFGTGAAASAFTIAFLVPNFIAQLFANAALGAAFVPVFTDLLQRERRQEAFRLASTLFWIMLLALSAITAFFILTAGLIMPLLIGPEFTASNVALTVGLSQVLFPVILLLGLTGLLLAILQSYDRFTLQSL
ncbi:MAG TPA: lipid II flippase MurJ, partial [Solirubrobacteraceae bacterium]|nr:lipid II flippase MurJ [Solirubrobacteraceae bacterium]